MCYKAIFFGIEHCREAVEMDLNEPRLKSHLRSLARGGGSGSTTEDIVIAFVNNDRNYMSSFNSVQDAWERLDAGQKDIVIRLRSFLGQPHISSIDDDYCRDRWPHLWLKGLVAKLYFLKRDDFESMYERAITFHEQLRLAQEAEERITNEIGIRSTLNEPLFTIIDIDED